MINPYDNILVTGGDGMLGYSVMKTNRILSGFGMQLINGKGHSFLDITDIDAIRKFVKKNKIKGIINCAAYTNVDKAETEKELAYKINAIGPENLAIAMKEIDGFLIHISTDYVYGDGFNRPISEDAECNPINMYGLTKYIGELKIQNSGLKSYIIIRTSWLYGVYGNSFPDKIIRKLHCGKHLKIVNDQTGTPTNAADLAHAIFTILTSNKLRYYPGIYNYSNDGTCSWYDFAYMIASYYMYSANLISPCSSQEFTSPAKRPAFSVLDKSKIKEVFNVKIPFWGTNTLKNFILEKQLELKEFT